MVSLCSRVGCPPREGAVRLPFPAPCEGTPPERDPGLESALTFPESPHRRELRLEEIVAVRVQLHTGRRPALPWPLVGGSSPPLISSAFYWQIRGEGSAEAPRSPLKACSHPLRSEGVGEVGRAPTGGMLSL
jgi:hypothetical protein